jgi:hypothetical protein
VGISDQIRFRRRTSRLCGALALVFVVTLITPGLSPAAQSSSLPPTQSDITIAMIVFDEAMLSPLLRTDGTYLNVVSQHVGNLPTNHRGGAINS